MTNIPDLRGRMVTCTRCKRSFRNVPHDTFYDPQEWLEWKEGGVCYDCILELGHEYTRKNGYAIATRRGIPLFVQRGVFRRMNGPTFLDDKR